MGFDKKYWIYIIRSMRIILIYEIYTGKEMQI